MTHLNDTDQKVRLISYLTVRKCIGFLTIGLPFFLSIGGWLCCVFSPDFVAGNFFAHMQPSISHYYYTNMSDVLVGGLCALALFLFTYKGYDTNDKFLTDDVLTNISAVGALGVAFFPCDGYSFIKSCPPSWPALSDAAKYIQWIHFGSATALLLAFALLSICCFTKTDKIIKGRRKVMRNTLYQVCGWIIIVAMAGIGVVNIPAINKSFGHCEPTFYLETICLFAFGFSWLTKGEMLLKDK